METDRSEDGSRLAKIGIPSLLHPRKWRTRAPVLTGGPGAAPGGVASKNGWVYMRVRGESISYSLESLSVVCRKMTVISGRGLYI